MSLYLVVNTKDNPEPDPLAVLHLDNWPIFNHSKSGHVRISEPHSSKEMGFLNPNFPFFGESEGAV